MFLLALLACHPSAPPAKIVAQLPVAEETPVQLLELTGPAASADMEFSGLAWLGGGVLAMVPQYPRCGADGDRACLYVLREASLWDAIESGAALEPVELRVDLGDAMAQIDGFEGLEALAVHGGQAWVSIEASPGGEMQGWIVPGTLDGSALRLDPDAAVLAGPAVQLANKSVETLFYWGAQICGIDEANGAEVNPAPRISCFSNNLEPSGQPPMAALNYRVTDATEPDEDDRIWVTNYQFSGHVGDEPAIDPLMERFGVGPTHALTRTVERLVELQLTETGVELTETPPIVFELEEDTDRNWEGVVRFGDGFLVVTDKFPGSLLGYVERP
ncbi:MAG: hypothetical protein H6741_19325 [Alphaproteobacteria bacterium]|nr:hypothetical protein [Alphaproteobacteria bacterium]